MIKQIGDYLVAYTQTYVDDEYEELMEHRSNTIFMWTMNCSLYTLGAILAWVLPGLHSIWGFVVSVVPTIVASMVSKKWMRKYVPYPKPAPLPFFVGFSFAASVGMAMGIITNIWSWQEVG